MILLAMSQASYPRNSDRVSGTKQDFSADVANHYNSIEQTSTRDRRQSRIIDLRNFNNATKDYLLTKTFMMLQSNFMSTQFKVLDMCCGKGGDLLKYINKNVGYLLGADIADVSIEQARGRYESAKGRIKFSSDFIVSDLTKDNLREKVEKVLKDKSTLFHVASAQFCIHYSYESMEQAVQFIRNAHSNLEKLGFIVGTYPDGPKLHKLASLNNGVYEVEDRLKVEFKQVKLKPKPFGTKYHFFLEGVVDCPEFVVHPDVMRLLFEKNGFMFVYDYSFAEFVQNERDKIRDTYRKFSHSLKKVHRRQVDSNPEYEHLNAYLEKTHRDEDGRSSGFGTLPKSTWNIASVYRVFCYRKI